MGNISALKGNQENAISGKQEDSVQEETDVVSVTEIICVDSQHNRPLLLQDRKHKMTEEDLREETHPGASRIVLNMVCVRGECTVYKNGGDASVGC